MELDFESKLYGSLFNDTADELIELCKTSEKGALHICTIYKDTVLHALAYLKKIDLANKLLDQLPECLLKPELTDTNDWGDTILHNAATTNQGVGLLSRLLQHANQMLRIRNNAGETAIFYSIRYGRRKTFEYLAGEIDKFCETHKEFDRNHFFQRKDKTTILHMAILTGRFELALVIASRYSYLCNVQAQDRLTALQMLACNPAAFRSGTKLGFLQELIYSRVSIDETCTQVAEARPNTTPGKPRCIWPVVDKVKTVKKRHEDVLRLAKILISLDTSWKNPCKPNAEFKPDTIAIGNISHGNEAETSRKTSMLNLAETRKNTGEEGSIDSFDQQEDDDIESCRASYRSGISSNDEIPLILAARRGCIDIVKELLERFPQAVGYRNKNGETILHEAIKNRNMNVFYLVKERAFFRGLIRCVDSKGNSILHMVGLKGETFVDSKMKSPVLQLSEDLLLLEKLKKHCPSYVVDHHNNEMQTADELFALNNKKLRDDAKDWLKRTAEHCTVVIVLVATVAFAAAYTVPGGPNQQTGFPLLIGQPFFLVFTMTDVLSLAFALTAVVVFLSILTSPFQLKDFRRSLPQKLLMGFTLLFLSVSMMMVSFAATIILMIHNKERWTKISVYCVAFFPVCIFVLSYIPLYIQLVDIFKHWGIKVRKSFPRFGHS